MACGNSKTQIIRKEGVKNIMAKKVIVAKLTHEGKEFVGKREVKLYEGDTQEAQDANVGLTLRTQRVIRDALKVKYGIKSITSGGKSIDLSGVENV